MTGTCIPQSDEPLAVGGWVGGEARYSYELADHLGNVRATVGRSTAYDTGAPGAPATAPVDRRTLLTMTDYYAFGWEMPGRTVSKGEYKYGFNGKETATETKWLDYGARFYNPKIARFFRVDPLEDQFN